MPSSYVTCPSCGKMNVEGGRYCIECGAILSPIYCSSCGTKNPDGLERCLECGQPLPSLAVFKWNPIVTVLTPTSAMSEEKQLDPTDMTADNSTLKWFRGRHRKRKTAGESTATSANNQTW